MLRRCFLIIIILYVEITLQDISISDLNTLSELPLKNLLHVKNSLEHETELSDLSVEEENGESIAATLDTSQAQALHGKIRPVQRGSYETWQKKGGGKKGLSTIFQITITALAFLAFAGYLLCLLVQAIKAKQMTTTATTAAAATVYLAPIRKRRPIRHRREVWPEADPEELYYALKSFSEGYATYHTVDYKYYNYTVDSLG